MRDTEITLFLSCAPSLTGCHHLIFPQERFFVFRHLFCRNVIELLDPFDNFNGDCFITAKIQVGNIEESSPAGLCRFVNFQVPWFPACSASYIKSGSKWQSGLNSGIFTFWSVRGNRFYWGTFGLLFSDTRYTGLESEIANFAGRKTGLIIPFWLADRRSDGLE